jgi:hypothetical protein
MSQTTYKEIELETELYNQWLDERASADEKKPSRFITISREFGCDGFPTALHLNELLAEKYSDSKWFIFSRATLEKLIADDDLGAELINEITEKRYSFVNWFFDGIVPEYIQSPHLKIFERLRALILNLAVKGNAIFVGGGGQIITNRLISSRFWGIHVRVIGSHEFKVRSVMRKFNLNRGDAENQLEEKQSARDKFIQDFTWQTANDDSLYHLIINNQWSNHKIIAKTILNYMELVGFFEE